MRMGSGQSFHNVYHLTNKVRVIKCKRKEEDKISFKILTDKTIEKRPLGRHRHKWEDINKINLKINRCTSETIGWCQFKRGDY